MTTTRTPVATFNGRAPLMSNADYYTHLALTGSRPGARESLCGYTARQLREATRRDLATGRGLCPVCIDCAYP